jgi:hypothetical protein
MQSVQKADGKDISRADFMAEINESLRRFNTA